MFILSQRFVIYKIFNHSLVEIHLYTEKLLYREHPQDLKIVPVRNCFQIGLFYLNTYSGIKV